MSRRVGGEGSADCSGALRTLHVVPSMAAEWGGPPAAVAGLTKALGNFGVHSEIVTATQASDGPLLATPHLTRHCFKTGMAARAWHGCSRALATHLERTIDSFDLVHVHGIWHFGGLMAARIAKRKDVPYVVTLRGELDGRRLRHKWLKKRLYRALLLDDVLRGAEVLHAVSAAECAHVAQLGLSTPVFVCPNGVDLAALDEPTDEDLPTEHRQLRHRRVVLYLGRIESLKGFDVLAQAFVDIASERDDVALLVAGRDEDGTLADARRTWQDAGVADRAVLAGFLVGKRKTAALACADVFVLSSYSEGFSNAVLEALAAGLPVVISPQCNFPQVEHAGAGFVVPSERTEVAKAIVSILEDSDMAARMARNARRLVEENYRWPTIASRMAQRYRAVLRGRRGGSLAFGGNAVETTASE